MMVRQALIGAIALVVVSIAALVPAPILMRSAALPPLPEAIFFAETGQTVRGEFLQFWAERGQASVFGLPITAELVESGRVVQYFERARFERVPGLGAGQIQLGLLGREVTANLTEAAFTSVGPGDVSPERRYFPETGHSVAFAFKRFWETNSGQVTFGYPISEELTEVGRTVQYFERARFEYRPEAGPGTDVALTDLGRQVARARGLSLTPGDRPLGALEWSAALAGGLRERQRQAQVASARERLTPIDPFQVAIAVEVADTYWAPALSADDAGPVYGRHIYLVDGVVRGESVNGDERWYRLAVDGSFIPAAQVAPFMPPAPPQTWPGRWIDVNLSTFYLTVYEDDRPIRSALITAGRKGRTPTGVFYVQRRVRSETMNSATVGFPKGHPEYYYLPNVEYTQYFTGAGHAIHGNYWVHPSRFGQFISNGCIGLRNHDAAWVWSLTTQRTPIHIHY